MESLLFVFIRPWLPVHEAPNDRHFDLWFCFLWLCPPPGPEVAGAGAGAGTARDSRLSVSNLSEVDVSVEKCYDES